jgi:hypothetical protein
MEKSQDNRALLFEDKPRRQRLYRSVFALWMVSAAGAAVTYGNIFGVVPISLLVGLMFLAIRYGRPYPDTIHATGDSLWVTRRDVVEEIPFSNIHEIVTTVAHHSATITLRLREPGKFGRRIRFAQALQNDLEPPFFDGLRNLIRLYPSGQHQQIKRLLAPPPPNLSRLRNRIWRRLLNLAPTPSLSRLHRPIDTALIQMMERTKKGDIQGAEEVYRQFVAKHPTVDASPLVICISGAWMKVGQEEEATIWLKRLQSERP